MYAKVFRSLWDGTLADSWQGWAVFVFLLAHADADGVVDMTPGAISRRSGLEMGVVEEGLRVLMSPDGDSRSDQESGRRIVPIDAHRDWGWVIVNHKHYTKLRDYDMVRAQTRERVRKHREVKRSVTHGNASKRHIDVDVDTDIDSKSLDQLDVDPERVVKKSDTLSGGKKLTTLSGRALEGEEREWANAFVEFWDAYPRKVGKPVAEKSWMRVKPKGEAAFNAIMDGLERWNAYWKAGDKPLDFVPHPSTWLNQVRWEDRP